MVRKVILRESAPKEEVSVIWSNLSFLGTSDMLWPSRRLSEIVCNSYQYEAMSSRKNDGSGVQYSTKPGL